MEDQFLYCVQCDESFLFTVADQHKFLDMGYDPPKRCPHCRKNKTRFDITESQYREVGKKHRRKRSRDQI
jgi:rubrerythrin